MTSKPVSLLIVLTGALLAPSAVAELIVYDEDPALFGDLNQANTDCPRNGCGPTAAVNSFVFLQNEYPSIYGDNLVPGGPDPSQSDQADIANALADFYMKTCCRIGTPWENFVVGKQDYFDDIAPDTTVSSVQSEYGWNPRRAPMPGPQSGITVQTHTDPTIAFILNALQHNQDLEIFISDSEGRQGHYLTVTGIGWDTDDDSGYLSFVDPDGGEDETVGIASGAGEPLSIEYNDETRLIRVAVDESPIVAIPEPGSVVLSLPILMLLIRRLYARGAIMG